MFPLKDDNPTTITPVVTWALIAVNVAVFLYQTALDPRESQLFVYQYGAIPAVVTGAQSLPPKLAAVPPFLSIFTSIFLHGGWLHLIGNMWYLWIFGNNIEEAMGAWRYIVFYLICGFLASMSQMASDVGSVVPTIGASGAIAGVLGAYLLLYPRARVLTFVVLIFYVRILYIPAGFMLVFWFALQLASSNTAGNQAVGGIAFGAHIGGFIAGCLLVGLFKKKEVRFFNPARQPAGWYHE
jgi:membrane associated rhomboid family serine protease